MLNHVCGDSAPAYGAVTGFVTAGPVGAIVGGAVGYAGSSSDVGPASTWYLSKVGGAVACAAFVVAGPVTAVAAGAAAVGGAYFVKLPYVDKLAIGRQAAHVTKEMALQISSLISDLTTPRLTLSESETAALEAKRAALAAKAEAAMMEDNFALRPLNEMEHAREWRTLEHLLGTDPKQLGKGKDAVRGSSYSALRLAAAWHIDNPAHRIKYEIARGILRQKLQRLERKGALKDGKHRSELPTMSGSVESLGGLRLEPPEEDCNETLLLHGTNEANLWSILSNGLNERYSGIHAGAAFGEVRLLVHTPRLPCVSRSHTNPPPHPMHLLQGIYFAEDIGKSDQYCEVDAKYQHECELHRKLYGQHHRHPGNVCYVLVCRVALGYPAVTTSFGKTAKHRDTHEPLFPLGYRELAQIPGDTSVYDSLIVATGGSVGRFREFVTFHGENVCPAYLLAFQRA